jgi:hypothetical protein
MFYSLKEKQLLYKMKSKEILNKNKYNSQWVVIQHLECLIHSYHFMNKKR